MYRVLLLAAAVALPLVASPAQAQQADPARPDMAQPSGPPADAPDLSRDTITIGVLAGVAPSYDGSNDYVVVPAPVVRGRYKGMGFSTRGAGLEVDVIPDRGVPGWKLDAGPIVKLDFNRTGRVTDRQVRALGKRKLAVELGGFAGITRTGVLTSPYDSVTARVSYVTDVSGVNHGYIVTPAIEYGTPLSRKAYVGIGASADYASSGYAHTYFDVPIARAAAARLTSFSARGGWKDWSVTGIGNVALRGDLLHGLSAFSIVSYSRLQNDFARSPIVSQVGSANQFFGGAGLAYTF